MACGPQCHNHRDGPTSSSSPSLGLAQPPSLGHTANGLSGISKEHLEAIKNRVEKAMVDGFNRGPGCGAPCKLCDTLSDSDEGSESVESH